MNVAARDAPPRVRLLRREEYIYKKRVRWRRESERAREQKHIKKKKEKKNARECILRRRVAADPPPASQTFLLKGKREMRRRRRRSIGSAPFYSSRARVKLYVLFFSQYRARKSVGQTVIKHKKTVTHFYSYLFHVCDLRRVFLLFLLPSMLSPAVSSLSSSSSSSSSWISSLFMPGAARRRKRDQRNEDG